MKNLILIFRVLGLCLGTQILGLGLVTQVLDLGLGLGIQVLGLGLEPQVLVNVNITGLYPHETFPDDVPRGRGANVSSLQFSECPPPEFWKGKKMSKFWSYFSPSKF